MYFVLSFPWSDSSTKLHIQIPKLSILRRRKFIKKNFPKIQEQYVSSYEKNRQYQRKRCLTKISLFLFQCPPRWMRLFRFTNIPRNLAPCDVTCLTARTPAITPANTIEKGNCRYHIWRLYNSTKRIHFSSLSTSEAPHCDYGLLLNMRILVWPIGWINCTFSQHLL